MYRQAELYTEERAWTCIIVYRNTVLTFTEIDKHVSFMEKNHLDVFRSQAQVFMACTYITLQCGTFFKKIAALVARYTWASPKVLLH